MNSRCQLVRPKIALDEALISKNLALWPFWFIQVLWVFKVAPGYISFFYRYRRELLSATVEAEMNCAIEPVKLKRLNKDTTRIILTAGCIYINHDQRKHLVAKAVSMISYFKILLCYS